MVKSKQVGYDFFVNEHQSLLNIIAREFEESPYMFSGTLELDTNNGFISKFLYDCGFTQTKFIMNENDRILADVARGLNEMIPPASGFDAQYINASSNDLKGSSAYCPLSFSFRKLSKLDDMAVKEYVRNVGSVSDIQVHYVPGFNHIGELEENERLRTMYTWDNLLNSCGLYKQITWQNRNHHIIILK